MNGRRLGRIHRALRRRLGRTQRDVCLASGVGRNKISELENGDLSRLTVAELERCFESMDATLVVRADWNGAAVDRLLDDGHAALSGAMAEELRRLGWHVEVEVTFSRFGDRGSIDLLAWHASTQTLLVVEIKTELASVEGLLRPLNLKQRLAPDIAREQFGWDSLAVGKLVVFPEDRTARRVVARHASLLQAALPARTREARRWLAAPSGRLAGLMFLTSSQTVGTKRNPSAVRRVRKTGAGRS